MDMRGQTERRFAVTLKHLERYRFQSQAHEDGRLHGAPYLSDEPDPVGDTSGPSTPALLGSALGHCLSAALLEMLKKQGVHVLDAETEAVVIVKPNDAGLPRIDHVDITIRPTIPARTPAVQQCEDAFGCHCTVTCSVRKGIDVRVNVDWVVQQPALID